MIGPSSKRRAAADAGTSRQARLLVDRDSVALQFEDEADEIRVPVDPRSIPEWWVDSGVGSFTQTHGHQLWTSFFSGALGLALQEAAARAASAGEALTLRVAPGPEAPFESWWAPWEWLCDRSLGGFLGLASGRSIVRGTRQDPPPRPLPDEGPLRMLVVSLLYLADAPPFWRQAFEQAPAELAALREESERSEGRLELDVVEDPDLGELLDVLATRTADVVHVIGTGIPGEGLLARDPASAADVWGNAAGAFRDVVLPPPPHRVTGGQLAASLARNATVGLVTLNGCHLEGMAETVADQTAIAVLGHRGTVADPHAAALTSCLYPPLLEGKTVDLALTDARRSLEQRFPGQAAWASTVLFTGWPPPRFGTARDHVQRTKGARTLAPPAAEAASEPRAAADLVRLLHDTNLERLRALPAQEWEPVASQIAAARPVVPR